MRLSTDTTDSGRIIAAVCLAIAGHIGILKVPLPRMSPLRGVTTAPVMSVGISAATYGVPAESEASKGQPQQHGKSVLAFDAQGRPPRPSHAANLFPQIEQAAKFGGRRELEYVPRRWLDVPPKPLKDLQLSFPDVEGIVDITLNASVFIDEHGLVRRVEVETPNVHDAIVQTVVDSLERTQFSPGEIAGGAVRSHIRIQISFRN